MTLQEVVVPDFEALLEYVKSSRGFDSTGYKRSSLMRRVEKRMQMIGINGFTDYTDYLEVHPEEFTHLFNTILINVTSFFRDAPSWEYLAAEIVPRIIEARKPNEPIRVWSAGCASGEEAYTIAILLAEALGPERYQSQVKIYGTDADEEALSHARQASYSAKELAEVPKELIDKYFDHTGELFFFRRHLRRAVIFGRHDLIQDAPVSRIDLLICRNTLMYFNNEAQSRILARFHFGLNHGGFLFLGKAEMLLTRTNIFTPLDLKRRVFQKVSKVNLRDRLFVMAQTSQDEAVSSLVNHARIRDAAFEGDPVAQIVVDTQGFVVLANDRSRKLFDLNIRDAGRPLQDLDLSYRPIELRAHIDQVIKERRPITLREVSWPSPNYENQVVYLNIQIWPLMDVSGNVLGTKIMFLDVTRTKMLEEELQHSRQEVDTAYEELQSTNEELETTNEELQSTVEELETMNEELQSTNEELETVNDELNQRGNELTHTNAFMESILRGLNAGVVVLNPALAVLSWNQRAEDLWGLRQDEVQGKHFLNLDFGLPVDELKQHIRDCLGGNSHDGQIVLEAINRRGKQIQCSVACTPLTDIRGEISGVILLMQERRKTNAIGR